MSATDELRRLLDERGRKVYVLKDNGRKEYNAEPTVRKLKG